MSCGLLLRRLLSKKESCKIYQLTRELAQFKQGDKSLCDYYATLREMWHGLSVYQPLNPCCEKEQEKTYRGSTYLWSPWGLNSEYETVRAQILSQALFHQSGQCLPYLRVRKVDV